MQKTALLFANSESSISLSDLEGYAKSWIIVGQIGQLSQATLDIRKLLLHKLVWFLKRQEHTSCGVLQLREFVAYITQSHDDPEGRWGNGERRRALRPISVATYYKILRTFFRFLVDEGALSVSPMDKVPQPPVRCDQIQPFSQEQVASLIQASKRSRHPRRDEAIVLLLLDTGMRASELCGLRLGNVDLQGHRCTVMGKGSKRRTLYLGRGATRALVQYLRELPEAAVDTPVFTADRGPGAGEPLTRSGLLKLITRLGTTARIEAARCSPHTFRHTFAIEFLRAGGQLFALKELLGHTSLTMVNRYVALAQADLEKQHRQFSPVDRMNARLR